MSDPGYFSKFPLPLLSWRETKIRNPNLFGLGDLFTLELPLSSLQASLIQHCLVLIPITRGTVNHVSIHCKQHSDNHTRNSAVTIIYSLYTYI